MKLILEDEEDRVEIESNKYVIAVDTEDSMYFRCEGNVQFFSLMTLYMQQTFGKAVVNIVEKEG